ncbi:MAG: rRNA adenine N-6-methyltransferase family protein, partial [Leptotrichiaceae bacterium]
MSKFINKSEETNYNAKKKYGQNFLEDNNLLLEIIESASLTDETEVIEIGPGL